MRIKRSTGIEATVDWVDTDSEQAAKKALEGTLREALLADNLVVFAGLGTTLHLPGAPTMRELWSGVREQDQESFDQVLSAVGYDIESAGEDIEGLLSRCRTALRFKPLAQVSDFVSMAESHILDLCKFVNAETDLSLHQLFLKKLGRRPSRADRARIFTTNYDLCFEVAASRSRFVLVDGFDQGAPAHFDAQNFSYDYVQRRADRPTGYEFVPNVVHLYKLHGSVDWSRSGTRVARITSPENPVLIYPRDTKYELSFQQPFLELMSALYTSLRLQNCSLLIVGSGLKDTHIAEPIRAAVLSNPGLRATVVSPSLQKSSADCVKTIRQLIDAGDSRLTLVEGTFSEVVRIMPDLTTPTEAEIHQQRLERLAEEAS